MESYRRVCGRVLVVLVAALLVLSGRSPGAECLTNGDFEDLAQGWLHAHWSGLPEPGQVVSDDVYGGQYAYRLHHADCAKTNYLLRAFTYTPGESYTIRLAMKGVGLAENGALLRVLCMGKDANGQQKILPFAMYADGRNELIRAGGTFGWRVFEAILRPEHFPAGTTGVNLYIYHLPNNQGQLWIDEVSVTDSRPALTGARPAKAPPAPPQIVSLARGGSAVDAAGQALNVWPDDASFETGSLLFRLSRDSSVPAAHGRYSLCFPAGEKSAQTKYLFQLLRPNREYRVSFYVRGDRAGECVFSSWNQSYSMIIHQRFQVGTAWQRVSFAFPVSKTATSPTVGIDKALEQTLWLDAIQISEGAELPEFSPASEISVGVAEIGDESGFVGLSAEPLRRVLRVYNAADEERPVRLEAALCTTTGEPRVLLNRELRLAGGALHEEEVEIMPACARGYYVLRLRAVAEGATEAVCDVPYVVMDEPLPLREGSFFGIHPGPLAYNRRMGASWLRHFRHWRWLKEADGHYVFPDGLGRGARDYGFFELECINVSGPPPQYLLKDDGGPDPAEQDRVIREYVVAAKESRYFEIENEPDLSFVTLYKKGLEDAADRYSEVIIRNAPAIRQLRPDAKLLGAGVSGVDFTRGMRFVERVLTRAGEHLDILPVHPYADARYVSADGADIGPELNGVYEKTLVLQEKIKQHGGRQKIWFGEIGWGLSVLEDYLSPASRRHAAYCVRLLLLGMSAGVEKVMVFLTDSCIERQHYYYGLWRAGRPLPAAAAYAATAQILDGATPVRRLVNSDIHCFSYRHRDGRLLAALWTSLPNSIQAELALPAEALALRDMFNNPLVLPAGPAAKLTVTGEPLYIFCGAGVSDDAFHAALTAMRYDLPPVACAWQLQRADSIGLLISNLRQQALTGFCRLDGADFAEAARPLALAPGEAKLFSYQAPASLHGRELTLAVTTSLGDLTTRYKAEIAGCPAVTASWLAAMGGAELPAVGRLPVMATRDFLLPNDPGNGWAGPEDLSVESAMAYDEEKLYLAINVRDDVHFQQQRPGKLWANDAIQVGVDSLANALPYVHGYAADDYEFGFGLSPDGPAKEITQLYEMGRHAAALAALAVQAFRAGDRTCYRVAIPWRVLKLTPIKGMILALNVVAIDNDGHGQRFWMGLTPGIVEGKNPYVFTKFSLE